MKDINEQNTKQKQRKNFGMKKVKEIKEQRYK